MRLITLAILAVVFCAPARAGEDAPTTRPAAESVLRLYLYASGASGFLRIGGGCAVVTDRGVLTATHNVDSPEYMPQNHTPVIVVVGWDGASHTVDSAETVSGDLTRLHVTLPYPALPAAAWKPEDVAAEVVAYWGPGHQAARPPVVRCHGRLLRDYPQGVRPVSDPYIPSDIPLSEGMSGAPVLVDGKVVGLASKYVIGGLSGWSGTSYFHRAVLD